MKFEQLLESERKQLDEISRRGLFFGGGAAITASYFGLVGVMFAAAGLPVAIALIPAVAAGFYGGAILSFFAQGKQRDLYEDIMSLVAKRDKILKKVKEDSKEDKPDEKQIKMIVKITKEISDAGAKLESLLDNNKGTSGIFRRDISKVESKKLAEFLATIKNEKKSGKLLTLNK